MKNIGVLGISFVLLLTFATAIGAAADVCSQEFMQCPDGSYVSRNSSNNCEFAPCLNLCVNVTCSSPPQPRCSVSRLITYNSPGTCNNGACSYPMSTTECQYGCSNGKCNSDPCAVLSCNSPPSPYCFGDRLIKYNSPGTCSEGVCSYSKSTTTCPYGCSAGSCNPQPSEPQSGSASSERSEPAAAPVTSTSPTVTTTVSSKTSYHGRPPEPIEPEPRNSSGGSASSGSAAGGFAMGSATGETSDDAAAEVAVSRPSEREEPVEAANQSVPNATTMPPAQIENAGKMGLAIEHSGNVTLIISGNARAETTEIVKTTDSGVFVRNEAPESEIKILPDRAQQIAKKTGVRFVTSIKIEMKETAIYSIHGYSEKRLFGILPVKVSYEISLNAKEGSIQKVSKPWWGIFAI